MTSDNPQPEPNPSPLAAMPNKQSELALVAGVPFTQLPDDLYIPPDALEVFLEAFEGPLDLLLYLIKRQNLDILDIKVAEITQQYMQYIELMTELQFELAAEYLVMAAMLAEIKSRMLLPRQTESEQDEDDPRAELIRRLQEYEQLKTAALALDELPRANRDFWVAQADAPTPTRSKPLPEVQLQELLVALAGVLRRTDQNASHQVRLEPLSTRERMSHILGQIQQRGNQYIAFVELFDVTEGRAGVVVTFVAMLELIKESLIELVQTEAFAPIHIRTRSNAVESESNEVEL